MRYFDLHCDTASECLDRGLALRGGGLHVDLNETKGIETYFQCCAAFVSDKYRGEDAVERFMSIYRVLNKCRVCKTKADIGCIHLNGGIGLIPTIESAAALGGKLENIEKIASLGVKMITLTWNGDNELGGGIGGTNTGLSSFGKASVDLFEKKRIILDVSHGSLKLFDDICSHSKKPFVASHSNSYTICQNKRNLSDSQAKEIISRGGLIGINFYVDFLDNSPLNAGISSIINHVEHFLSLGGRHAVAFGSDFDGSTIPGDIRGIGDIPKIYRAFQDAGYENSLLQDIFYNNAVNFMLRSFQ